MRSFLLYFFLAILLFVVTSAAQSKLIRDLSMDLYYGGFGSTKIKVEFYTYFLDRLSRLAPDQDGIYRLREGDDWEESQKNMLGDAELRKLYKSCGWDKEEEKQVAFTDVSSKLGIDKKASWKGACC